MTAVITLPIKFIPDHGFAHLTSAFFAVSHKPFDPHASHCVPPLTIGALQHRLLPPTLYPPFFSTLVDLPSRFFARHSLQRRGVVYPFFSKNFCSYTGNENFLPHPTHFNVISSIYLKRNVVGVNVLTRVFNLLTLRACTRTAIGLLTLFILHAIKNLRNRCEFFKVYTLLVCHL